MIKSILKDLIDAGKTIIMEVVPSLIIAPIAIMAHILSIPEILVDEFREMKDNLPSLKEIKDIRGRDFLLILGLFKDIGRTAVQDLKNTKRSLINGYRITLRRLQA